MERNMHVLIGCDFATEPDATVLSWEQDADSGFCALPTRGERLVYFPGQPGMRAFGCVEWRKAKRWLRLGKAQRVREFWK